MGLQRGEHDDGSIKGDAFRARMLPTPRARARTRRARTRVRSCFDGRHLLLCLQHFFRGFVNAATGGADGGGQELTNSTFGSVVPKVFDGERKIEYMGIGKAHSRADKQFSNYAPS